MKDFFKAIGKPRASGRSQTRENNNSASKSLSANCNSEPSEALPNHIMHTIETY
jgi:hypothetical protein